MEDHPPLPNASPLLQTCKLPKTVRTAQNRAKAWSVCKPAKERSSPLLHNLPYARACPSVLIKPPPASPPDFLFTCHTPLFLPSLHTSRESLSCSRSIESQPCGRYSIEGLIESLCAICLISPCIYGLLCVLMCIHKECVRPKSFRVGCRPS